MDRETLVRLCLSKPGSTSDYPFDETTLALRVGGKIFALVDRGAAEEKASLKCDPELSRDLRATYPQVTPGWHLNKEHWISLSLPGLEDSLVAGLVERSWELVAAGLTQAAREKAGLPPHAGGRRSAT